MELKGRSKKFWNTVIILAIVILGLLSSVGNSSEKSKKANSRQKSNRVCWLNRNDRNDHHSQWN